MLRGTRTMNGWIPWNRPATSRAESRLEWQCVRDPTGEFSGRWFADHDVRSCQTWPDGIEFRNRQGQIFIPGENHDY